MTTESNPYASEAINGESPTEDRGSARSQLLPVAITLLVISILHIVGGIAYFVFVFDLAASPDVDPMEIHTFIVNCLYYAITMLYSLMLISGAFSMMRQGSYMWAMAVCILSLIPLLGPCWILAVPVGVWGIVILKRPAVRDSFARM